MRLVLATPSGVPQEVVERLKGMGFKVEVAVVHDLEREPLELARSCGDCIVIVPGSTPYTYPEGSGVVKGTYSPLTLPHILEEVEPSSLSPSIPAEKVLPPDTIARVFARILRGLRRSYEAAFSLRGLKIPLKPPPILVASEVYVNRGVNEVAEATWRLAEGADIIVLGAFRAGEEDLVRALSKVKAAVKAPIGVDPGDRSLLKTLAGVGADLLMSLELDPKSPPDLSWIPSGVGIVFTPPSPIGMGVWDTVTWMQRACSHALEVGVNAIVDPVVLRPGAPRGPLVALTSTLIAGKDLRCPVMLGLNNVYEMLDADTQGSIAALTILAGEAGASLLLVGEESWKSRWATLEARLAADIASISLHTGAPPKDVGFNLLPWKGKREGEGAAGATPCTLGWEGLRIYLEALGGWAW